MASTTTNLGLTKPAYTDSADVAVINSNMDILDTKIGAIGNTSVASQIGTLSEQIDKVTDAVVVTDFNTCTETGVYCGNSASNSPIAGWVILSVIRLANNENWVVQVAHETNNNRYFVRSRDSGTWRNWEQLMRNSSFTPSSYTAPTNIHSNATLVHGGYVRVGNMIVINARFNITTQIQVVDTIAQFPGYNLAYGQVSLTNNKGLDITVNQSGEMKSPSNVTTGTFIVTGTYFVV